MSPGGILIHVVIPLGFVALVGAFIERRRLFPVSGLTQLGTLALTPALIFSRLAAAHAGIMPLLYVFALAILPVVVVAVGLHLLLGVVFVRQGKVSDLERRLAVIVAAVPNTGNFGLPLAAGLGRLAGTGPLRGLTPGDIIASQTALILAANMLLWLAAPIYLKPVAGAADPERKRGSLIPIVSALAVALVISVTGVKVPDDVLAPVTLLGDAAVPVMLLALGGTLVNLRAKADGPARQLVAVSVAVKLVVIPLAVAGWAAAVGQWPLPGYELALTVAAPTAVLATQLNIGEAGKVAVAERTILWSTLLSVASLSLLSALLY